jgi:hypothetical protein
LRPCCKLCFGPDVRIERAASLSTANRQMRILDYMAGVAVVATFLALPFSFYYFRRRPIRSILILGIPILISFCICDGSQRYAKDRVFETLGPFDERSQISINGTPAPNPKDVLLALKTLRSLSPHHSSPTKRVTVEISDGSHNIALSLARDSSDPREYWVFYPKYYITKYKEIGRIVTPLFDNY